MTLGLPAGLLAGLLTAGCTSAPGEQPDLQIAQTNPCLPGAVHSSESIALPGGPFSYDVCAGTMPVSDGEAGPSADLFYTAYFARERGSDRPLSFVWNGGPGADSRLLHFKAMGPALIVDGQLVDNPSTPLIASDLVFLDPAGTGFSRARSKRVEQGLYGTLGDIAATKSFVTAFREAYSRSASPLYLFGESFGTWRAAGVADALADDGVRIAGIGLISGGIPLGDTEDRALMRALSLPNRTATALALEKLDPQLQSRGHETEIEAERWAREIWYPALASPETVTPDRRQQIVAALARYHGMDPSQIDGDTMWISPRDFRTGLLSESGKTLGVFDMRTTGEAPDAGADEDADTKALLSYYRDRLGYRGGAYAGIESAEIPVGSAWQYDQAPITEQSLARAMAGEGPPSPSQPWTVRAMRKLPQMRTFVAAGKFDSLNSCAANDATIANLPDGLSTRIAAHCYAGGHMMYDEPRVRSQFAQDVITFLSNSSE